MGGTPCCGCSCKLLELSGGGGDCLGPALVRSAVGQSPIALGLCVCGHCPQFLSLLGRAFLDVQRMEIL